MVDDAAQFENVKPELVGIRGWLAVLAFAQVVAVLRLIGSLAQHYRTLDANFWTTFPAAMWGEALLNAAAVVLGVYTTVLLFRRSRDFPRFFILHLIGVICLPPVDLLWLASKASLATGEPISDYLTIDPKEGVQMIAGAVGALIWLTYILKSRRVANTFTRCPEARSHLQCGLGNSFVICPTGKSARWNLCPALARTFAYKTANVHRTGERSPPTMAAKRGCRDLI